MNRLIEVVKSAYVSADSAVTRDLGTIESGNLSGDSHERSLPGWEHKLLFYQNGAHKLNMF